MDQICKLQQECSPVGQNTAFLPKTTDSSDISDISVVKDKKTKIECDTKSSKKSLKSWKGRNHCTICRLPKASKRSKILYSRYSCPCDIDLDVFEEDDLVFLEYCDAFSVAKELKSNASSDLDEISNQRRESLLTILNDIKIERFRFQAGGEGCVADGKTDSNPRYYLLTLQNFHAEKLKAFEKNKVTSPYYHSTILLNKNNNKMEAKAVLTAAPESEQRTERDLSHASTSHDGTLYGPGDRLPDESTACTQLLRGCSSTEPLRTAQAATDEKTVNTGHVKKQSNEWIPHKTSFSQSNTHFKVRPKFRKSCTQLLCKPATGSFTGEFQITFSRDYRDKTDNIIAWGQYSEPNEPAGTRKMEISHNLHQCSFQQSSTLGYCMKRNIHTLSKSYQNENNLVNENDKHVSFSSTTAYFSHSTDNADILENPTACSPTNLNQSLAVSERNNSNDTSFGHVGQQFSGKVIHVQGDGRCLFRSLVASQCQILQATRRDDYGRPERTDLATKETERADDLRARVVRLMKENLHFYSELGKDVLNADQPMQFSYKRFLDRLQAMTITSTMPGDLELNAAAMVLESPILVLSSELRRITTYGLERFPQAPVLAVRYTRLVEDVGHYDAVILDDPNLVDNSQNMDVDDLNDPFKNHIHQFSRLSLKDKEGDENGGGDEVVEPKTVDTPQRVYLQAKKEFFFLRDPLTIRDRVDSAVEAPAEEGTRASSVSGNFSLKVPLESQGSAVKGKTGNRELSNASEVLNKHGGEEETLAVAKENPARAWSNKQDLLETGSKSFNGGGDMYEEDARFTLVKGQVEKMMKRNGKRLQTRKIKTNSKKITSNSWPGLVNKHVNTKEHSAPRSNNGCSKRSRSKMQDSCNQNTSVERGTPAKRARLSEVTQKKLDTLIPPRTKFNSKTVSCSKKKPKGSVPKYKNAKKARHENVNENSKTQRVLNYSLHVFKGNAKRTCTAFDKKAIRTCASDAGARFIPLKNKASNNTDSSKYELTGNRSPYNNKSIREKEKKLKSKRRHLGAKTSLREQTGRGGHQEPKRANSSLNYSRWNFQASSQKRKTSSFGGGVRIPKPPRFSGEFMSRKQLCFLCRDTVVCQGHSWLRCSICHRMAHRECVNRSFPCWDQHRSDEEYFLCQDCVHLL